MKALNIVALSCARDPADPVRYTVHTSLSELCTILEALRSYGADKPYRLDVHDLIRDIHEITRK